MNSIIFQQLAWDFISEAVEQLPKIIRSSIYPKFQMYFEDHAEEQADKMQEEINFFKSCNMSTDTVLQFHAAIFADKATQEITEYFL